MVMVGFLTAGNETERFLCSVSGSEKQEPKRRNDAKDKDIKDGGLRG
jgi:hypothetical protein